MPKPDSTFEKYADMLDMPHHVSPIRAQMSMHDRAAQFSPFAALTGHDAAIREAARLTDIPAELDENSVGLLNEKIRLLIERKETAPEICITYFASDLRKQGGTYAVKTGRFKDYHTVRCAVIFEDLTEIPVDTIYDIQSKLFDAGEF